ncbi:MAG: prepilin-type N-terminal cleavage/methylation domain-containing protein [Xanthomonadales bacterium]|jgi:general secretion pathway protein J|nr:prepilin-type N-terminal cleavage/methylation domain-containing protein [Xanthomonadales bacterium]
MTHHSTRRQAGFTLVELLLAVTLMGLLLALAYGGLRAASRASESGQAVLAESSRLRVTHQFVRKQMNLMLPLSFLGQTGEEGELVRFEGDADRITFVGPMPGYLARGGPQVQQLAFVDGPEGLELQFTHAPLIGYEPEALLERDPVVLFTDLQGGEFSFLFEDLEAESIEWVSVWEDPAAMPKAVRLDVQFPVDSPVHWPPMVASVRLDPSAVVPGSGSGDTYAERIQEMIRNSRGGDNRD